MRCNLFKPLGAGDERMGTFLMFSQYADDLTKEESMKGTYRIVPSKFVALDLNIDGAFNSPAQGFVIKSGNELLPGGIVKETGYKICNQPASPNAIISQILQSYYENGMAYIRNHSDDIEGFNWDAENRTYANEMLWRTLERWGFIHKVSGSFEYYDEVKYIGDINIHSNKKVGAYTYDEVFCHIPANDDEYRYPLKYIEKDAIPYNGDGLLEEWTDATYPTGTGRALVNKALMYESFNKAYYPLGGNVPVMDYSDENTPQPEPRNPGGVNVDYNFNAVIVFYDILYSEPGEDPRYLHQYRPMGIYLSGPIQEDSEENDKAIGLKNTFTKYISNNDAYGQGASFGLRIMMRYVPTPNMSTYTMEVDASGNDYETITQAMGNIADAIVDINRTCKDQHAMFQAYKDHLAMFRNRRVNVPYPRLVHDPETNTDRYYWFVNGRNTGQPCTMGIEPAPQTIEIAVGENTTGGTVVAQPES